MVSAARSAITVGWRVVARTEYMLGHAAVIPVTRACRFFAPWLRRPEQAKEASDEKRNHHNAGDQRKVVNHAQIGADVAAAAPQRMAIFISLAAGPDSGRLSGQRPPPAKRLNRQWSSFSCAPSI
jgi:hypothetical protein